MIFTYNLLFGLLAALGSNAIQMAMFWVNVFSVRPTKTSNLSLEGTDSTLNEEIYAT
jgi:hypothetical protein